MNNKKSFTLIEVLVTLGILMILITVVIGIINPVKQRNRAADAVLRRTMGSIATSLENYYSINGKYPAVADVTEFRTYINAGAVTVAPDTDTLIFTADGVETGDTATNNMVYDPDPDGDTTTHDACMYAISNEDVTVYLRWDVHGPVVNSATACP